MKTVCYNQNMLDKVMLDMVDSFQKNGELYVDYGKPFKEKTLRQLGFFFGAIVDSIIDFYSEKGIEYSVDEVKENFYQAISPKKTITQFNGKTYDVPKRISEMSLEEMSLFIDRAIWLCDNAKAFSCLILHPSIRYTWIRNVSDLELMQINKQKFPRTCREYLEYTRKQACLVCGVQNMSEAHHLKEAGRSGVGYKADDVFVVPLCRECHLKYHTKGKEWFNKQVDWITKYMSMTDFCLCCFNRYYFRR